MSDAPLQSPYLSALRVWCALAWADGVLVPAEIEALRRLIVVSHLSADERAVATGWLDQRIELEMTQLASLGTESRQGIYQAAVRLARIDGSVAAEERALLQRLSDALGIAPATAADIEARLD
jgi:tellurite resistance protein